MTRRADVCVLGAGPAGSTAAIQLSLAGLAVALVESTVDGRARPGEHLAPDVASALTAVGVPPSAHGDASEPSPGRVISWSTAAVEESSYLFLPEGRATNVDRARFDRVLVAGAEAAGAAFVGGARIRSAEYDGRDWTLHLVAGGTRRPLQCGVIFDATGRRSAFARSRGARVITRGRLVAAVATLPRYRSADRRFVLEAAPDGWWYCIPVPGRRLVVGWVTAAGSLRATADRGAAFAAALDRTALVRDLAASTGAVVAGAGVTVLAASSGLCTPMFGPGWLAIGDAAGHVDPLWGRGVPHAMELGMRAAEVVSLPPAQRGAGFAAYEAAVRGRWFEAQRTGAEWYGRAARRFRTPFWMAAVAQLPAPSGVARTPP